MRCKSGRHEWTDERDAAKCCNGWRRVLAIGPQLLPEDRRAGILPGPSLYGYQWVLASEDAPRIAQDAREGA